jgi:formylmethanofuran dehydrogenase subunit E
MLIRTGKRGKIRSLDPPNAIPGFLRKDFMPTKDKKLNIPEDLARCVEFHGHICPGLVYGYLVAKEAMKRMNLGRSEDEEIVAVCENDSCAVDALQVLLGTSAGKGNLIIRDFGKNAFTVLSRSRKKSYRFVRKVRYEYSGPEKDAFDRLDTAIANGTASASDWKQMKLLKVEDLLRRAFDEIFTTTEIPYDEPHYAPLERSEPCVLCGEMTMASKMIVINEGLVCIPCSQKR